MYSFVLNKLSDIQNDRQNEKPKIVSVSPSSASIILPSINTKSSNNDGYISPSHSPSAPKLNTRSISRTGQNVGIKRLLSSETRRINTVIKFDKLTLHIEYHQNQPKEKHVTSNQNLRQPSHSLSLSVADSVINDIYLMAETEDDYFYNKFSTTNYDYNVLMNSLNKCHSMDVKLSYFPNRVVIEPVHPIISIGSVYELYKYDQTDDIDYTEITEDFIQIIRSKELKKLMKPSEQKNLSPKRLRKYDVINDNILVTQINTNIPSPTQPNNTNSNLSSPVSNSNNMNTNQNNGFSINQNARRRSYYADKYENNLFTNST